jgi:hypothetical protein
MAGIGLIELIVLAICGLTVLAGLIGSAIWIVAMQRRGHGPLVSCPQCGRNSPRSPHCPNCGAALQ